MGFEFVTEKEMKDKYRGYLDECLEVTEGLRGDEIDFLEKLTNWEGCFTIGQAKWLEKIWERVCE